MLCWPKSKHIHHPSNTLISNFYRHNVHKHIKAQISKNVSILLSIPRSWENLFAQIKHIRKKKKQRKLTNFHGLISYCETKFYDFTSWVYNMHYVHAEIKYKIKHNHN